MDLASKFYYLKKAVKYRKTLSYFGYFVTLEVNSLKYGANI